MSFQAMTWAIDQTPPDAESKLILLLLANYSGSENTCWPSVPRLARETLLAERTVRKRLHDLSEAGFIKITPRINPTHGDADSNLYLLLMPQVGHAVQGNQSVLNQSMNLTHRQLLLRQFGKLWSTPSIAPPNPHGPISKNPLCTNWSSGVRRSIWSCR